MIGIANARMVEVSHMSSHLVEAPGFGSYAKQGTPGFLGTTDGLHNADGVFPIAIVIFHRFVDSNGFVVFVIAPDECEVGLGPITECAL